MADGPFPGGRSAAIALTYDDALPCHRTVVGPALTARGLLGTFFPPAASDDLHEHVDGWRALAAAGHELGNHSIFHPCRGRDGADWPLPEYDLRTYTRKRVRDEWILADRVLRLIDGRERRAVGPGCGDVTIGANGAEEDFSADLLPLASIIRLGGEQRLPLGPPPTVCRGMVIDHRRADEVFPLVEQVLEHGGWCCLIAHGVGAGTHPLMVDPTEHERLLDFIAGTSDRLWAGTLTGIVDALRR